MSASPKIPPEFEGITEAMAEAAQRATRAATLRQFSTGAIRDQDTTKLDFDGCLSPLVLEAFAQYMHKHRKQLDGTIREEDNWQKGMPLHSFMKSGWRHFFQWWKLHRGWEESNPSNGSEEDELQDALCGVMFNAMGYLHEHIKEKRQRAAGRRQAGDWKITNTKGC